MLVCHSCGHSFFPQSSAWGDQTCGDCIAVRIELLLMETMPTRIRRPMRRAVVDLPDLTEVSNPSEIKAA